MNATLKKILVPSFLIIFLGCCGPSKKDQLIIQEVNGARPALENALWLSHEHILVDFIGADSIRPDSWDREIIMKEMVPYLNQLKTFHVTYFVDATPHYLGRDPLLLRQLSEITGLRIITNTGLYGASHHRYIPEYAYESSARDLARGWINEFNNGIDGTSIKPGFIKISVNNSDPLNAMDEKLVRAAAMTHLETGLTIASHTGKAKGLWPQLGLLEKMGVSGSAFIWVHAQNEDSSEYYLQAAKTGCWISLDGVGPSNIEMYVEKLQFCKAHEILNQVLISHDAGWFDPQKEVQSIRGYTTIFTRLIPELTKQGFTGEEIDQLIKVNPSQAYSIKIRKNQ